MRPTWNRKNIDIERIYRLYHDENKTASEIASLLEVGVGVIYSRLRELGITRTNSQSHIGKRPSNYRGWYVEGRTGYKIVLLPKDSPFAPMAIFNRGSGALYVREHRLVMAQEKGRPLQSWEIVHHINHNKLDNRIENLELIEGQSRHNSETITHEMLLRLKKENQVMSQIIDSCESCRAALLAVTGDEP